MAYAALESTDWHPSLARDEGPIQTQILTLQHLLECSNGNGYIMLPVDWLTECVVPRASCDLSEAARQALIVELGSAQKPIPRLSKFFLNLAFSTRQKRERRHFCCDGCWRKRHSSSATNFARDVVNKMGAEL